MMKLIKYTITENYHYFCSDKEDFNFSQINQSLKLCNKKL